MSLDINEGFTLQASNTGIVDSTASTQLSRFDNYSAYWTLNGKKYVVLGQGDLLIPKGATPGSGLNCIAE